LGEDSALPALLTILVADLLFFLFFGVSYPEVFDTILALLPWEDSVEKAIIVISGLIVAVASSAAIIQISIRKVRELIGGEGY